MAAAATRLPTSTEPVKLIAEISGALTSTSPIIAPEPITRLKTPAGSPARAMISASAQAEPGTRSAGFKTKQIPQAGGGADFPPRVGGGEIHRRRRGATPRRPAGRLTPEPGRPQ